TRPSAAAAAQAADARGQQKSSAATKTVMSGRGRSEPQRPRRQLARVQPGGPAKLLLTLGKRPDKAPFARLAAGAREALRPLTPPPRHPPRDRLDHQHARAI